MLFSLESIKSNHRLYAAYAAAMVTILENDDHQNANDDHQNANDDHRQFAADNILCNEFLSK